MRWLKGSGQAVGAERIAALAGFASPTVLSQAARLQGRQRFFNLTVTNVPGPQFPLFLLGRRLRELYPLVPLAENTALGVAIMSYDGSIDFGLVSDYDALPDLDALAADLAAAILELADAAGVGDEPAQANGHSPLPARAGGGASVAARPRVRARWQDVSMAAGPLPPLRLALAQVDVRVGRPRGQRPPAARPHRRGPRRGRRARPLPRARAHGLSARGPAAQGALPAGRARRRWPTSRGRPRGSSRSSATPSARTTSTTRSPCSPTASVHSVYRKMRLPNYGVFDEQRYFQAGDEAVVVDLGTARIGLSVCEDIWLPGSPANEEALAGATLLVNASASPYFAGKGAQREAMLVQRARDNLCAVAFCNLVGGQDELVFDGHSLVIDHEGTVLARAPQFAEALTLCTVDLQGAATARLRDTRLRPPVRQALPEVRHAGTLERAPREPGTLGGDVAPLLEPEAEVYAALCLGVRDYVDQERLHARRARPVGRDRLHARRARGRRRARPGPRDVRRDAVALLLARARSPTRATSPPRSASSASTSRSSRRWTSTRRCSRRSSSDREPDITEENLQARIRGNLLMALSNKFGWLVLTTGNKSENAVGYSTLYGDSAGGFAVIKDVPKTLVYRLVDFRNDRDEEHPVPRSIVDRPPSAELRPDQVDADSLPDYDTLDAILQSYIEQDAGREQLALAGLPGRGRRPRLRARRPQRVQAPPGAAGDQDHAARVRARPPHADHQRLPRRLTGELGEAGADGVHRVGVQPLAERDARHAELGQPRRRRASPGRSRTFTGAPSAVKAAMSRSSAIPIG